MITFCDATNFTLCVLLESIDLMLLTLTRRVYKAIGGLGNYLGLGAIDSVSSMTGYRQAK